MKKTTLILLCVSLTQQTETLFKVTNRLTYTFSEKLFFQLALSTRNYSQSTSTNLFKQSDWHSPVQLPDGTTEYTTPTGNIRVDFTRYSHKNKDINKSNVPEYENKEKIEKRPDGSTITTYPDGSVEYNHPEDTY